MTTMRGNLFLAALLLASAGDDGYRPEDIPPPPRDPPDPPRPRTFPNWSIHSTPQSADPRVIAELVWTTPSSSGAISSTPVPAEASAEASMGAPTSTRSDATPPPLPPPARDYVWSWPHGNRRKRHGNAKPEKKQRRKAAQSSKRRNR